MNLVPINPDDTGLALQWAKDVLVTNCTFRYFKNIPGSATPNTLWCWSAILGTDPEVINLAVLNCAFNGNVGMTTNSTEYASDGLTRFGHGGQWIVRGCGITNYQYEALFFASGPGTAVENSFDTKSLCGSSCALNTYHNYDTLSLSSPRSPYTAYCFVDNTVSGGGSGVHGPEPGRPEMPSGPYALLISANQFDLPQVDAEYPGNIADMEYAQYATLAGNIMVHSNYTRGITYCNPLNHYTNEAPNEVPMFGTNLTLLVQGNDFSTLKRSAFYLIDSGNKVKEARFLYNKLGNGLADYGERHMLMELLPVDSANAPILTVQGNQFYNNGYLTNWHFSPGISGWTTNAGTNYAGLPIGWNTSSTSTRQYKITDPNGFTNNFSYY